MGKRELFIILGFVAVGIVAYQLTAPASTSEGFSFSRMWEAMRREVHGNPSRAETTLTGAIPVTESLSEVRFDNISRLHVLGETRKDVSYELKVESNGPDEATALSYAKAAQLVTDDMGTAVSFRVKLPQEGRQTTELTIKVPLRLNVRVQGGSRLDVSNVASVRLDGVSSTVKIHSIAGPVTGTHRGGELEVIGVGSVHLTLQGSHAAFHEITQPITLDLRAGTECEINRPKGAVEIEESNSEVKIVQPEGTVRIGGERGRILVEAPGNETRVDVRRAEVEVLLRQAVPVTLVTTDEELRLLLEGPPAIKLDAVAPNGQISTPELDVNVETSDREARLAHTFGDNATARVSLRNLRGEIVIRMAK
jgi:hypothetical protein